MSRLSVFSGICVLFTGCISLFLFSEDNRSWTDRNVAYFLNEEANGLTEEAVTNTFRHWQEQTGLNFIYRGRNHAGIVKDEKNTVSFLKTWPKDVPQGLIGYCYKWYDRNGHIVESDIIFNMKKCHFTTLKAKQNNAYYIEGVLTHEIGHMLGLGHSDLTNSVMKPYSTWYESYFKGDIDRDTLHRVFLLYHKP